MTKRMVIMLVCVGVLFGAIFGWKAFINHMMTGFFDNMPMPVASVSTAEATRDDWALSLEAVGTVQAVNGVDVTSQVGGEVGAIEFRSGDEVKKGDVLVRLESRTDQAQLKALEATAQLARQEYQRYEQLFKQGSISRSELDNRRAQRDQSVAQADAQRELLSYKTIRAPFDGVLGIRRVDLGQYLQPGSPVVSLAQLDPIYVNFALPEQDLSRIENGLAVRTSLDAYPDQAFEGTITAIEPGVNATTRNVTIQASFENTAQSMRPGMFANVTIQLPKSESVVVIPRTAVAYAPYGNSVFVVQDAPGESTEGDDNPSTDNADTDNDSADNAEAGEGEGGGKIVRKRFVKLGRQQGDLVVVESGLEPGETVATSGLLKLRNDAPVTLENDVQPSAEATPTPANS